MYNTTGDGPKLEPVDIGHSEYIGLIDPDTAFWSLVRHEKLAETIGPSRLRKSYLKKAKDFEQEMHTLRFGLKPSAVYFNITERCNLNCCYCYIPESMRKNGKHMSGEEVTKSLKILKAYFKKVVPKGMQPKIIFHGAEPLLNKDALFNAIEEFDKDFLFGVQTNAVLLDKKAVNFLKKKKVSIGISLDGPTADIADKTRVSWAKEGCYDSVIKAMGLLKGYDAWSVICTVTNENMASLSELVEFFHAHEVPSALLNVLRCTLPASRKVKPDDLPVARHFIKAIEKSHQLYKKTGRKLVIANFANIIISILAPTARRLMCDISPCGGGRSFFALAPSGDMFPCSEFIGLKRFAGGNIFKDKITDVIKSEPFQLVTNRKVEDIEPCDSCAIRHFCGAPCPAEAHEMNGGMDKIGAFCEFYEEQVRYAFRLIADHKHDDFLWKGWSKGTKRVFSI